MALTKKAGSNNPPIDLSSDEGKKRIRSMVDRINRLEDEKAERVSDIKDIYTEGASAGISPQALRIEVRHGREDEKAREKRAAIMLQAQDIRAALGEFSNSPLGQAAIARKQH